MEIHSNMYFVTGPDILQAQKGYFVGHNGLNTYFKTVGAGTYTTHSCAVFVRLLGGLLCVVGLVGSR